MDPEHIVEVYDDVSVWVDPSGLDGGGITIKAVTPEGDPVELSATEAREPAAGLVRFADLEDSEDGSEYGG
ncbi:MAG: hypothetical protein M3Q31_09695 [Actinomycetota bacterium]|nr:hypothetical protein [Actinomycetota bacterium]